MSGDQLDLDAIEARAARGAPRGPDTADWRELADVDVPALVAEVRNLREDVAVLRVALDRELGTTLP